ncbi:glycosyltransferase [Methylocaldum marinum]|uniref:Glycosyltransferase n=1 Tax=Methylocaldum marinum TaxID=1432792 RepID=A0A250KUK9_9GAMM|nr:glycosyltransferase [Methylocaldum marinum]BBA35204.1 glycosyltransferase [Methylocaldum marinum]
MNSSRTDLALFLATSGHSGVDRIMRNLVPEFAGCGLHIDLLKVDGHGPYWDPLPHNVRTVDLGVSHVNTALPVLIRYLRRNRPRVLLSDKDKVNRTALTARTLARVDTRVVVRIGTTVSKNLERRGWWARNGQLASIRLFYRHADGILTPSEGAAEDLAKIAGLPMEAVTVVTSPVLTDGFAALADQAVDHPWFAPGEPPVILGVGELCARKDFATLLKAFAELRSVRPCRLIIGGEGRQRDKLLKLAGDLGVSDDVDFPGFLSNPYAYMRRAKVFALTSICEGMPVVLIEAMACGTPVVSTDCPSGPKEVLGGGRYGALVAVGDSSAFAGKLAEMLDRPTSPEALCEATAPYTISNSARQYLRALGLSRGES